MFNLKSNLCQLVFNVWWGHTWCFGDSFRCLVFNAPAEFDVTFDFAIYLCSQKYNNKIQLSKNFPKCFSLMVTFYIRGSKLILFSCRKFCCFGKTVYVSDQFHYFAGGSLSD